jgi:O-antigen/teichoic acid export membrane protein
LPSKVQIDLAFGYASLAMLAASGVALNVLIGRVYGPPTLGAFNQVLAAFVVFSMLASGGIGHSVLRATAEHASDPERLPAVVLGALVPSVLSSAIASAIFHASADAIASLLESPAAAPGIRAASVGLFFFGVNKILLSTVNGLGRMRAYALFQSLRYALILAALALAVGLRAPGELLPGIFTFAETLLFAGALIEVSRSVAWWRGREFGAWARDHVRFGLRGGASGILVELNSRVDVLMIGYFLSDAHAGVYSFAAFFAEGFFQILVVVQNTYHPVLAQHLASPDRSELERIVRRVKLRTYAAVVPAAGLSALAFPVFIAFAGQPDLGGSHAVYGILVAGTALAAGYLPFQNTLAMANLPGWQTIFMAIVVLANATGNAVLIPRLGIDGAAFATSLSVVLSIPLLVGMVRRLTAVRI